MTQENHDGVGRVSADLGEHDCTNPLVLSHSRLAHLERRVVCSGTPQVLRDGINNPVSASWCGVNGKATPPSRLTGNRRNRRDGGSRGSVTPTYRTPVARSRLPSFSFSLDIYYFFPDHIRESRQNKRNEWTVHACTALPGPPPPPPPSSISHLCKRYRDGVSISELSNSS